MFGIQIGWAEQYETSSVIVTSTDVDPTEVLLAAQGVDAIYYEDSEPCYVIDFRVDDHRVGPELYTERALLSSLRSKN